MVVDLLTLPLLDLQRIIPLTRYNFNLNFGIQSITLPPGYPCNLNVNHALKTTSNYYKNLGNPVLRDSAQLNIIHSAIPTGLSDPVRACISQLYTSTYFKSHVI